MSPRQLLNIASLLPTCLVHPVTSVSSTILSIFLSAWSFRTTFPQGSSCPLLLESCQKRSHRLGIDLVQWPCLWKFIKIVANSSKLCHWYHGNRHHVKQGWFQQSYWHWALLWWQRWHLHFLPEIDQWCTGQFLKGATRKIMINMDALNF